MAKTVRRLRNDATAIKSHPKKRQTIEGSGTAKWEGEAPLEPLAAPAARPKFARHVS